ncbi:SDR family oxidoreductase [Bacillus sp. sid0103]|uniref:SDR family NAD(P)-dependent oxidoreductase n=1 Tax=Bacillus sp. sid0103 TaxID=2856337 RepID=UPI001C4747DE|nr:SDR family NAD(P)-dependent oxidoreductase [Bacillus sp. sid0103]MBV7504370.1 SDR family oxidoreductase [Bacillus sp. sid0103]
MDFQGKVAVITGGSLGIGYAAAKRLAQGGASVVICGSRDTVVKESGQRLQEAGLKVKGFKADVRSAEEVEMLMQYATREYGGIDILVNSAGVQRYGDVLETSEEVWDEVININLKGMFLSSKYAVKEMRNRGGGAIVNVSSVQAFASQKGVVAYTASKGGINAMTRAMALDHADENIRVNVVCPASVDTPMLRGAADLFKANKSQEKIVDDWGKMHPVGRVGTPDEVAEMIAFLASDKAKFVTGAEIKIDGGMLAALGVRLPE